MLAVSDRFGIPMVKLIDSKPLTVGAYSKDADARRGRVANGVFAKGYRLHVVSHGRSRGAFVLLPLNEHDHGRGRHPAADARGLRLRRGRQRLRQQRELRPGRGGQPPDGPPPRECNKGVRDAGYNGPRRLRGLDLIDSPLETCGQPSAFGAAVYGFRQRDRVGVRRADQPGTGGAAAVGPRRTRVALWAAAKDRAVPVATGQKRRTYGVEA